MNEENSKTNEPHKFVANLSQRFDFKILNKHVVFQNLFIYYPCKNKRQQYKNNKLKIIAPTCNDEFELPDGSYSVSDIQEFFENVITNHETLPTYIPFRIYINGINKKVVLKKN